MMTAMWSGRGGMKGWIPHQVRDDTSSFAAIPVRLSEAKCRTHKFAAALTAMSH